MPAFVALSIANVRQLTPGSAQMGSDRPSAKDNFTSTATYAHSQPLSERFNRLLPQNAPHDCRESRCLPSEQQQGALATGIRIQHGEPPRHAVASLQSVGAQTARTKRKKLRLLRVHDSTSVRENLDTGAAFPSPPPPCFITPSPAPAKHPIRSTWFAVTAKKLSGIPLACFALPPKGLQRPMSAPAD